MINSIYWYSLMNRKDAMKTQGIGRNYFQFLWQSFLYAVGIVIKILASYFIKKSIFNSKAIRLSWTNTFYKRLIELSGDYPLVHYDYKKINKRQILFFKNVNFFKIIRATISIRKKYGDISFEQDNIFYRFIISAETMMFDHMISSNSSLQRIYIAGINDRQTVMLSELCSKYSVHLSVLQHGCFTKFLNQYKVIADEFHYFYDFSIKYMKYFFRDPDSVKLKHLPRKQSIDDLPKFENEKNIAFATTPIKSSINFEIIDILLENLHEDVTLIINPHPVEKINTYINRYGERKNVAISNIKYKNVMYFVLRYSTLGIEMRDLGMIPVFINIENYQTDFFEFGNVTVFTDLGDFQNWLHNISDIRTYYKTG